MESMTFLFVKGFQNLLITGLMLFASATGIAQSKNDTVHVASGMFTMAEATGATKDALRVFYYRPSAWTSDKPVVIVLHGMDRNADQYCDHWKKGAEQHNFLVVCPEFSESKYPGRY